MRNAYLAACLAISTSLASAQCASNGLTLGVSGNRLGDPFSITVSGSPGVSGLLGIDASGGPTQTPIGPICLGLSTALQTIPFTLDSNGVFALGGTLPPAPALIGADAYLQAAAADPGVPGGLALSNGAHPTLRPPRIIFYDAGYSSPFGSVPGAYCIYDALTDVATSPAISLAAPILHAVRVPALDAVAFLLGNAHLLLVDAATGAAIQTIPLPTSPGSPAKLAVEGSIVYVLYPGISPNPFTPGQPGAIRGYSLPSGAPAMTGSLSQGNPNDLMIIPGTGFAYLRVGSDVIVVNLVTGATITTVSVGTSSGPIVDWTYYNGVVYCLLGGTASIFGGGLPPGFNAIDTSTQAPLLPFPAAYAVPAPSMLRLGPGSAGPPSLFAYVQSLGTIIEVSIFNFGLLSTMTVGPGIAEMQLSAGGTQWLLVCGYGCGGTDPELQAVTPPSMFPLTVAALLPGVQSFLAPLPSATMRKAFFLLGPSSVVPFQTDPAVPPYFAAGLPLSSSSLKAVID